MASRWFALAVAARREATAAVELRPVVDEVFLPSLRLRRAWSDRVKTIETPLFPGYLFVRTELDAARRVRLLKVKGVIDVVGKGHARIDEIASIPLHEIDALRALVGAERNLDPVVGLVAGTAVVIALGPLRGIRGVVDVAPDGQRRLTVNITILGRAVRTVLAADDVIDATGA